jgi:N-acetylglucosaminyldiphosphoundecaprenol N-acetyl-beta-D-mannosaminyltransferase
MEGTLLNAGKRNVLGILIDAADYEGACAAIFAAAEKRQSLTVTALAVHGLMTGALDRQHQFRLNHFDLLLPDGQPVRWVLNLLHRAGLSDRVYGPNLTARICAGAAEKGIPLYFYGTTPETLSLLKKALVEKFPGIIIAGMEPSRFRRLTLAEKKDVAERITASGAQLVFVGLGCPRQEAFAFEFRDLLPMPILAVGAAFPFLAGRLPQAPLWMQNAGLEWLFRLVVEPRRLWRRYLLLNPAYLCLVALQALRLFRFPTEGQAPTSELLYG